MNRWPRTWGQGAQAHFILQHAICCLQSYSRLFWSSCSRSAFRSCKGVLTEMWLANKVMVTQLHSCWKVISFLCICVCGSFHTVPEVLWCCWWHVANLPNNLSNHTTAAPTHAQLYVYIHVQLCVCWTRPPLKRIIVMPQLKKRQHYNGKMGHKNLVCIRYVFSSSSSDLLLKSKSQGSKLQQGQLMDTISSLSQVSSQIVTPKTNLEVLIFILVISLTAVHNLPCPF